MTKIKRVSMCGLGGTTPDGSVTLRLTPAGPNSPATAGFSGLFSCGNVWVCPVCSVSIAARRTEELGQVLRHFLSRGGYAVLITLTMRHHRGHSLAECLGGASKGWGKVTQGRAAAELQRVPGYAGWCRALEVTESPENGWHVHLHTVVVFDSRPSDDEVDAMAGRMFARWSDGLVKAGMPAPSEEYGLDVQKLPDNCPPEVMAEQVTAWAAYVAKGLAAEATMGAAKEAKGTNRTILQLMRAAFVPQRYEDPSTGNIVRLIDSTARDRLEAYERTISGRQQLTWSKGQWSLRERAGLEAEQASDEEIVSEDLEGEDVAVIAADSWPTVEERAAELLSVTERLGAAGAHRWLNEAGVRWWHPTGLSEHFRRTTEPPGGAG